MKSICKFAMPLFIFFVFSISAFSQNTPCSPTDIVFPNADCGTIAAQVSVNLDNMSSTGIGDPGGCPNNVFSAGNDDGWFQFIVPPSVLGVDLNMNWSGCSGFICVDNPGYAFYEALNGDCTNLVPFGCGGDNGAFAGSNAEVLITGLQPGNLILIRVWETDNQGSDVTVNAEISPPNDLCENAIPLQGLGCNYGATDINEPDGWAPENYGNIFTGYEDCLGGGWTSNENGVWYTFTIDATTPQPISLDVLNINCDNTGGGDLQMGIWQDNGACTLGESTFIECAVGTGNVTLGPTNLPQGDYYLYVDGNAGANCEWEFESDQLLCPDALFEDIIANSPYLCDDPLVNLVALDDVAAGGTIAPGFDFDILTDAFSDTENSVEIYDGPNGTGNLIGSFAIGTVPINSNWTINAEYFDTNTTYSLVWCDNSPDGTFGYTITDHATGGILATGTFNHNTGTSCFTVNFGPLSGIATFAGPGVTNNGDGTGTFDPSVAGVGVHDITYSWDSETGCVGTSTQTVEVLEPTIDNVAVLNPNCNDSSGSITIAASNGNTIEYSIDGGNTFQPSNVFNSLPGGSYDVVIQVGTCTAATQIELIDSTPPFVNNISTTEETCTAANAAIDINVINGTPPFTFDWDNDGTGDNDDPEDLTGISAGTYTVTVTDINGCTDTASATITDTPGATIDNIATTEPDCGASDGSLTIVANGGTAPLEYSIDNGTTFQASATFTGLAAGTYDIIVEDANGCSAASQLTLNGLLTPVIDDVTTTSAFCGNDDGTITITASGGTAPLEYSINNGVSFQLGNVFIGLSPNTYTIVVQDANGCSISTSAILGNQPGPTLGGVSFGNPNCGVADGSITITAFGGTPPYGFSIDNGATFQPGSLFTGLGEGTYDVVVEDANGCTVTSSVTLTDLPGPTLDNVATVDPTCGNADGSITITASGGEMPYEYSIDNGASFQPGNTFTGLQPGSYDIIVRDDNSCFDDTTVALVDQLAPTVDNITTIESTCGNTNGTITITASGGVAPIEYSIDNGTTFQPGGLFAGLAAGVYDLVVQDANACIAISSATVADQPAPIIDNVATTDPTCSNDNGAIVITATGGTAPLSYSIDNGVTFQANNVFVFQGSGVYDVIVSDVNGCIDSGMVTFVEQAIPAIDNIDITDTTCGDANGEIIITGSNGTAPLSYSINGGLSFQAANTFSGLTDGTYDVIVQDANGCTASGQATIAPSSSPVIVSIDVTDTSCNEANGALAIISTGGTAPLEYSIDGGTTFQSTNSYTGLTGGNYNIVVQDALGCSVSDLAFVTPSLGIQINNVQTNDAGCGDPGLINIMASSGLPPFEYSIDGGITFQSVPVFPTVSGGTYDIVVQDGNGCTDETTVTIIDTGIPNIDFAILDDPSSCNSFDGSIEIIASGGAQPLEYSNNNGMVYQPSPIFTGLGANTYNLVVMDAVGCTDTVIVILNDPIEAAIDTVFYNNPTCGEDNGSIEIIVDVSNPNYEYSIDGGNVFQGSNTFEDLPVGTYNIVMVDFLGCTAFWQPITLFNAGNPEITTIDITSPICGDDNGVITITANGGTTPYEYSIDNINYQTAATFVGLAPGMYTVWVRDAEACETQQDVYVTTTGEITATAITDDPTACDTDDGTITITASNGTPPYEYSVDNGTTYQSSNTFTGLGMNTYNVVVQDVNGCLTVLVVDLVGTDNPEILDVIIIDADCSEDNGSIEITVTGGTPNYQYSIDGGNIFQGSNTFEDLPAGMYDILVVDFKACEATAQVTVNNPGAPQIDNIEVLNPSCGDVNGSIIITASSGTAPLEYSIDGGITFQTNTSFTGLDAGIYDIIVRDAAACELFDQAILNNAGDVVIDQTFITEPICNDDNGGVVIIASGGTMPYEYSLDNGMNFQNSGTFSNVGPGTFNVVVTDANGCQATDQLMLTSDAPVLDSIGIEQPSCEAANGMISVFVQNGTANYQYSIDGGASYSADNIFENLPTGVYDVIIEDLNGCQATQTVELFSNQGANPQIIPGGEVDLCFNEPLTLDAGVFESYQWSTGDTTAMINVDQFGVYFVTVTNAFGCTGVDNVQVNVTAPFIVEASDDETIEIGDDYTISIIFNNPNLTYTWSGSDGSSGTGATFSASAEIQGTIIYTVTGTDANGCSVTDEVTITIVDTSTYVMPNAFSPNGDGLNEDFGPVLTGTIEIIDFKVFNRWGELVHSDANSRWDGFYKGQRQETDVYIYMIKMETFEGELIELTGDVHLMR